jgi:hypothetical protein
MAGQKIVVMGKIRFSETDGLQWPLIAGKGKEQRTVWIEALPNTYNLPGIPMRDEKNIDTKALHLDERYRAAVNEFLEIQRREPQSMFGIFWVYKDLALAITNGEHETLRDQERDVLLMKQFVLRRERDYERLKREVEALENLEKLDRVFRAPIAESVRLFVWQRDGGKCVKCGSQELLEFDHIIPVSKGGSSTERNIQLLCEACNRSRARQYKIVAQD